MMLALKLYLLFGTLFWAATLQGELIEDMRRVFLESRLTFWLAFAGFSVQRVALWPMHVVTAWQGRRRA